MLSTTWKSICCVLAALVCTSLMAAPKFSPETSSLFVDFVDPDGGVPGRMLKPGLLADVQQSTYFVQKCMTDDCRFMVVMCLDKEQPGQKVPPRRFAVIDFESDTVTKLEDFRISPGGSYFIDTAADKIYTVNTTDGFRVHDLTVPGMPAKAICPLPEGLTKLGSIQTSARTSPSRRGATARSSKVACVRPTARRNSCKARWSSPRGSTSRGAKPTSSRTTGRSTPPATTSRCAPGRSIGCSRGGSSGRTSASGRASGTSTATDASSSSPRAGATWSPRTRRGRATARATTGAPSPLACGTRTSRPPTRCSSRRSWRSIRT